MTRYTIPANYVSKMIFTLSIRRCRRSFFTCLPPFPFLHPHPAFLTCSSFHSRASCQPASHPHHPCQRRAGGHPSARGPKLIRLPADGTIRQFPAAAEIPSIASSPAWRGLWRRLPISSSPARSCGLRHIFFPASSPAIANWPVMK